MNKKANKPVSVGFNLPPAPVEPMLEELEVGKLYYDGDWQKKKGPEGLWKVLAIAEGYVMLRRNVPAGRQCVPTFMPLHLALCGFRSYVEEVVVP